MKAFGSFSWLRVAIPICFLATVAPHADAASKKLALADARVHVTQGESTLVRLDEAGNEFVKGIEKFKAATEPNSESAIAIGKNSDGHLFLAAPLSILPGVYSVAFEAEDKSGDIASGAIEVVVEQLRLSPSSRPPLVLLNGYNVDPFCGPDENSSNTFGNLQAHLHADGIPQGNVLFFDNCRECRNCAIEDIAGKLRQLISSLPVAQVDLVGHSMGGLIIRSYLSGKQRAASAFSPPPDPKVRKAVFIGTPHFGAQVADLVPLGVQADELTTGSQFLLDLATWNQGYDDLREVDSLGVIGNGGLNGEGDGVVSLTSGSLYFAMGVPEERVRIVPYCHVPLSQFFCKEGAGNLAKVDSTNHLSSRIIRSFLKDGPEWRSIGLRPTQVPNLTGFGGLYFAYSDGADKFYRTPELRVYYGPSTQWVELSSTWHLFSPDEPVYFLERVPARTYPFLLSFRSPAQTMPFDFEIRPLGFQTFRFKEPPWIAFAQAIGGGADTLTLTAGQWTAINGVFWVGSAVSTEVWLNGQRLMVRSATDRRIEAFIPSNIVGPSRLLVRNSLGQHTVNVITKPMPLPPSLAVSPTDLRFTHRIGGTAPTSQAVNIANAGSGAISWTASASVPWLTISSTQGDAPSSLTVSIATGSLAAGSYTGSVTLSSAGLTSRSVSVFLTIEPAVNQPPTTSTPRIGSVVNGASFSGGFCSGAWLTITGSNLARSTRTWKDEEIVNGQLPTALDGVRVNVNKKPAFVYFISPQQLNVQAPSDDESVQGDRAVEIEVITPDGTTTSTGLKRRVSPGLFTYMTMGRTFAAAIHPDGALVGRQNAVVGGAARPGVPGGVVSLYATGLCGTTSPPVLAGIVPSAPGVLQDNVEVFIGGQAASVSFKGLVGPGLYQVNAAIPPGLSNGDHMVVLRMAGATSQGNVYTTVGR